MTPLCLNGIENHYTERKSKQKAVAEKLKPYIAGKILDVGADEGHIKNYLPKDIVYKGIGLGGNNPDIIKINLEKDMIPFENQEFDTVMCLDVLEHLDNIHDVADIIINLSKTYVLISLPNPYRDFLGSLKTRYNNKQSMKFYGLSPEKQDDRHKWFYSASEAHDFIKSKAEKNSFIIQEYYQERSLKNKKSLTNMIKKTCFQILSKIIFRSDLDMDDLFAGTSWWVLKRK